MLYLETQILLKLYMFYWFINSQCMAAGCLMNTCFSPLTRWKYRLKKRKHTFWRETVRTRPTSSEINQWNQLIMMHFSRRRPPPSAVVIMAPSEGVRRRTFTQETAAHSEVTPGTLRDRACISDVVILSHVFLNRYQTASGWWCRVCQSLVCCSGHFVLGTVIHNVVWVTGNRPIQLSCLNW